MSSSVPHAEAGVTVGWSRLHPDAVGTTYGFDELVRQLPQHYATPPGPWVRANMISSIDGSATGDDSTSTSIGTSVDKEVFLKVIRPWADAVIVGAGTARDEDYGPVADVGTREPPVLVVVTGSANVPQALRDDQRTLLAMPASAVMTAREQGIAADRLVVGDPTITARGLRQQLHQRGYQRILLEGGPSLLAQWLAAGVVDDLCLTTSGVMVGAAQHPLISNEEPLNLPATPDAVLVAADTVLTRWRLNAEHHAT